MRGISDQAESRVDRAKAAVRRWELEAAMLGEHHLTLPPEAHPLGDARRHDHVRWREDALNQYQGGMCIRDLEDDRKDSTVPHIASRPQLYPTDSTV